MLFKKSLLCILLPLFYFGLKIYFECFFLDLRMTSLLKKEMIILFSFVFYHICPVPYFEALFGYWRNIHFIANTRLGLWDRQVDIQMAPMGSGYLLRDCLTRSYHSNDQSPQIAFDCCCYYIIIRKYLSISFISAFFI